MMRRFFAILVLSLVACAWSACGGSSNKSVNAGAVDDDDTTTNSERIESSPIAPTGGPGREPESGDTKPAANANADKSENKNKAESGKNKNTQ